MPREDQTSDDISRFDRDRCEGRRQRRRCVVALLLAGALVGQAGAALAEEPTVVRVQRSKGASDSRKAQSRADLVEAKQAYEEAARAFNLGQWDEAVAGFQKSYKLSGDAALLFNVAQAQRQAGHYREAVITYKSFLREVPETPYRENVEAKIRDLESTEAKAAADKPAEVPAPVSPPPVAKQALPVAPAPLAPPPIANPVVPVAAPLAPPPTASPAMPIAPAPVAPPPAAGQPTPISSPPMAPLPAAAMPVVTAPPAPSPPAPTQSPPIAAPAPLPIARPVPTAPATAPPQALDLRQKPATEIPAAQSGSRWWLWTGIGVVVAAGVVTGILLAIRHPGRDSTCPSGLDGCIAVGK